MTTFTKEAGSGAYSTLPSTNLAEEALNDHLKRIEEAGLPESASTASSFHDLSDGEEEEEGNEKTRLRPREDEWEVPAKSKSVSWTCFWFSVCLLGGWAIVVTLLLIYEHDLLNVQELLRDRLGNLTANATRLSSNITNSTNHTELKLPDSRPKGSGKYRFGYEDSNSFGLYGIFSPVRWIKSPLEPNIYLKQIGSDLYFEFPANDTRRLIGGRNDLPGIFDLERAEVSADLKYLLFVTKRKKQWRRSSLSDYSVFDISTKKVIPLTKSGNETTTSFAAWSPEGHSVMFVRENNLFVSVNLEKEVQVTFDGSETVFNGVPDWIYEEEVFMANFACWWAPDGQSIAYLRLNETEVPVYEFPIFEDPGVPLDSYTKQMKVKYPKPGYPNPLVSIHIFNLDSQPSNDNPIKAVAFDKTNDFTDEDRLIVEVAWMTKDELFVRTMNRVQDVARLWLIKGNKSQMVREIQGKGCWIDIYKALTYVSPNPPSRPNGGYIDLAINDGWQHLAYFDSLSAATPTLWLTSGHWEVENGPLAVDSKNGWVYYSSTEHGSMQRHTYRVKLDGSGKEQISPLDEGLYRTMFSRDASFYTIFFQGPGLPWFKLKKTADPSFEKVMYDPKPLQSRLDAMAMPQKRWGTITVDGVEMNYVEQVPPDFNTTETKDYKYGVLFQVYGGPFSQKATLDFSYDWNSAVASDPEQRLVVVNVDGRGTGFKGEAFRCGVRKNLGYLEALDLDNAAKHWSRLPYIDPKRIAVWGWSYGGYLTAKAVERNSGTFKAAMSVAPVTDWHFYDSIYTERYMLTPKLNPKGYSTSAVVEMDGFRNTKYLLVHGTGDDNVHFQQTAHLVKLFTEASVRDYRLQVFVDSDHSMSAHNAYQEIYALLQQFLLDSIPLNPKLGKRELKGYRKL